MSTRINGEYASYPNIPLIRNAMRNAAFKTGVAFWDLYEAMGGQNSMVSWVNEKPSLAAKDFTHFNPQGARYVGEMIYEALMKDYLEYKNTRRKAYP
jgi:lysophospholipase L1-like esterase